MEKQYTREKKARNLIDKMLQDAGWTILSTTQNIPDIGFYAVEEVLTDSGPMDYG